MTSLSQMVEPDSWARVVDFFVDALPITELGFTHSNLNKEGNLPYHPSDLFKLLLYGYRHGIRSANKLADACKINVEVMWLLKGLRPSARTVNYFRANNTEAIENAHRHFVQLLKKWQLVDGQVMALDGTRVRGQNSLKNNFNAKKIQRHLDYIDGKIGEYLEQLDEAEDEEPGAKQRKKIQELEDKIGQMEKRREDYEGLGRQVEKSPDGQVSPSDPDAKAVARNRGIVEVGYNIQATVDAKHKMVVDVFAGGSNDLHELGTAAKRAQQISGEKFIDMLADAGYHNGVELAAAERRGVRPFVAPRNQAVVKAEGFRKEDFIYDVKTDTYTCPAGEQMERIHSFKRGNQKKPYRVKRYATPHCANCPMRQDCTENAYGRFIERPAHQAYTDRNDKRVRRYPDFYRTRQELIEHVFGTWKRHWGMTHSVVKGKQKVEAEYRLTAICYNLLRSLSILGLEKLKMNIKTSLAAYMTAIRSFLSCLERLFASQSLTFIIESTNGRRAVWASF